MSTGWLTAYETRSLIGARREALTSKALNEVELSIIDNARTVLPTRCAFMRDKTLQIGGDVSHQVDSKDVLLPCWIWNLTEDWSLNWNDGTFHLAGEYEGAIRYLKLVGVQFEIEAVDEIWPPIESNSTDKTGLRGFSNQIIEASDKKKGGAQPKVGAWHAFWFEAMKMLHEGELHDTTRFPNQAALQQELLRRVDDMLSEASVKPLVSRIWHEFRG